jgi:hypothetical protein
MNLTVGGHRTSGAYVVPIMGAVPSGEHVEFVYLVPKYPPISKKLLSVHAAIAEVLHMIGASEAIEEILGGVERIRHLDQGGADLALMEGQLNLVMVW